MTLHVIEQFLFELLPAGLVTMQRLFISSGELNPGAPVRGTAATPTPWNGLSHCGGRNTTVKQNQLHQGTSLLKTGSNQSRYQNLYDAKIKIIAIGLTNILHFDPKAERKTSSCKMNGYTSGNGALCQTNDSFLCS